MWGKYLYAINKNVSFDLMSQYYYYVVKVQNKIDEMRVFFIY